MFVSVTNLRFIFDAETLKNWDGRNSRSSEQEPPNRIINQA